jgi:hypothetical protein
MNRRSRGDADRQNGSAEHDESAAQGTNVHRYPILCVIFLKAQDSTTSIPVDLHHPERSSHLQIFRAFLVPQHARRPVMRDHVILGGGRP